jgi:hypothetical protein
MDFVYDVNLVSTLKWGIFNPLTQIPDLLDSSVRCTIDLNDIDTSAEGDLFARLTLLARFYGRSFNTVQAFCQDPSGGRFTDTPRSGKQEGMSNPAGAQSTF